MFASIPYACSGTNAQKMRFIGKNRSNEHMGFHQNKLDTIEKFLWYDINYKLFHQQS